MTGIIFSLVSSVYKLRALSLRAKAVKRVGASEKEGSRRAEVKTVKMYVSSFWQAFASSGSCFRFECHSQQAAVKYQLIQDSLDILLPSGTLGFHNLDDGILGIVG